MKKIGTKMSDAGHHMTEYAFCKKCENKFSIWEQEREKLFGINHRPSGDPQNELFIEEYGYNPEYIKLACLTDLYRCSVFSDPLYNGISLGAIHERRIAKMLLSKNGGSIEEYPVILGRYSSTDPSSDSISQLPSKFRLDRKIYYKTRAPRGWVWIVKVDSQACPLTENISLGATTNIRICNFGDFRNTKEHEELLKTILN